MIALRTLLATTLVAGFCLSGQAFAQERATRSTQEAEQEDTDNQPARRVLQAVRATTTQTQIDPPSLQLSTAPPEVRAEITRSVRGLSDTDIEAASALLAENGDAEAAIFASIPDDEFTAIRPLAANELTLLRDAPARPGARMPETNLAPDPDIVQVDPQVIRRTTRTVDRTAVDRVAQPGRVGVTPEPAGNTELAAPPTPYLDVNGFGEDLHNTLANVVNGYTLRIRRGGQPIYTLQWNWSQRPGDGARGWNPDRRMHIASISKFMTAVGMLHMLDANNIDPDTEIAPWLPDYWTLGSNVDDITFEDLFRHESGFSTGGSSSDYVFMRQQVAAGVAGQGNNDYENMNYGLMRILMATMGNYIDPSFNLVLPGLNDAYWNSITLAAYVDYMNDNVFGPAGVSGVSLNKQTATARAYTINGGGSWNSGNLASVAGGAAWHMSVDEVLDVASLFRRGGAGLTRGEAADALAQNFGVDGRVSTTAGFIYHKNGIWRNTSNCTGRSEEQSVLFFMPEDMEMAIFVNSPVGSGCTFLRSLVTTLYSNNLIEP